MTNNTEHPAPSIQHRASSTEHPAPSIQHHASSSQNPSLHPIEPIIYYRSNRIHLVKIIDHGITDLIIDLGHFLRILKEHHIIATIEQVVRSGYIIGAIFIQKLSLYTDGLYFIRLIQHYLQARYGMRQTGIP